MTTQELFELIDSMRKVLCRLEVLRTDSCNRPISPHVDAVALGERLKKIVEDDQQLFDFSLEVEDLADEMLTLLEQDVQFTH